MNKRLITIIITAVVLVAMVITIIFVAFDNNDVTEKAETISSVQSTYNIEESTAQQENMVTVSQTSDSEAGTTTKTKKYSTTVKSSDTNDGADINGLTLNQALDILTDFYGTTYNVNATVEENGYQYFAVFDKKGGKYASVRVELSTGKATETILETNEVNDYNLLV